MKNSTALLACLLAGLPSLSAIAEDTVAGSWLTESVNSAQPPEGVTLNLSFSEESKATITYTLADESQSWQYTYTIEEGQLNLEPITSIGEPKTVTYDIKFDEGKLLLLTPKPKPIEEDAEETQEADADADADADSQAPAEEAAEGADVVDEAADQAEGEAEEAQAAEEEEEEEEEEDTRIPVWVLVKA